ncbi:MAG: gliding motility-associated C-terminal domain-containing protein [Ferruginibacter sp.]
MLKRLSYQTILLMLLGITKAWAQNAMPDTVCIGASRIYKVNDAATASTYTWKVNGILQQSTKNDIGITWTIPGIYTITVQEHAINGCDGDIRSGLVYVLPPPVPNAGPDQVVCFGSNTMLNGSGGNIYQWSPPNYLSATNIPNPVVNAPFAGVYRYVLDVTNSFGCRATQKDTVTITVLPPVKVFAGNDTSVAVNQLLQLNAVDVNNSGFINYLWTPPTGLNNRNIKNPAAIFNSTIGNNGITYRVTARTAQGCEASDDITVKVFVQADFYVPNAFTPNGDGLNDVIRPVLAGIRELKYFRVFNRYGEMVFATSKPGEGWNGIYKGERQNAGGFTWMAEAIDYRGNIIQKSGFVILIR